MIIVHCPSCSSGFDLMQAWDDEDARKFTALIVNLPPKAIKPCFRYLTLCFKPPKQALRWSKLLKLAQELAPMITDAQVKRNGTIYRVPLDQWVAKLTDLVESPPSNLVLPIKNHAYLLQILANQAEQGAGKAESKAEADKLAGNRAKPVESISFAQLSELALQHAHGEQNNPICGELVETTTEEATKTKPTPSDIKALLAKALNKHTVPQVVLTDEEKEAKRADTRARARALMNEIPQPTLD